MAYRRRRKVFRPRRVRRSVVKRRKYKRHRGKSYARVPFPSTRRVIIPYYEQTAVGAASANGVAQELIYVANGVFDCDTESGVQTAAYFKTMMQFYQNYRILKSRISVIWSQGESPAQLRNTMNFIICNFLSATIAGPNESRELLATNAVRSGVTFTDWLKNASARNSLTFRRNRLLKGSSFTDQSGNSSSNPVIPNYYHVIQYPQDPSEALYQCSCLTKIKYWVEFFNPRSTQDVYDPI